MTHRPIPCSDTLCLKNVPTFKLSVTLSNLNRFSQFYTAGKRMKFATNHVRQYHLTLGMLLHYLGKLEVKFSANIPQIWNNANKLHFIPSNVVIFHKF